MINYKWPIITCIVILFSVAGISCKKKPIPAPTPTPVNVPPSYSFTALGVTTTGVQYGISNPNTGPLVITGASGTSGNSNYQTVQITVNSAVNSIGSYSLTSTNGNSGVYTTGDNSIKYSTNATCTGTLNVSKIDMANRLMSASFNFVAQQYYPSVGSKGTISGSFTDIGF